MADFIKSLPDQSGPIYVWDINPDLYLRTDLAVVGRHFYLLPLMTPGYGPPAAAELLRSWQVQAPAAIVDSGFLVPGRGPNAPLLLDHPMPDKDGRNLTSDLEGLRTFVRTHYYLATIGGMPIYLLDRP